MLIFIILCKFNCISQLTFTVLNSNNNYSITCTNTLITLSAQSNFSAPVNYTWTSPQLGTVLGSSLSVFAPASITVFANSGTVIASQTLAIGINTTIPTVSISASQNSISCYNGTVMLTAQVNPTNVSFFWLNDDFGENCCLNTFIASYAGTYSVAIKDLTNGCKNTGTVSIGDNRHWPQFGAINLFTVACPNGTVNLIPQMVGDTMGIAYAWYPPVGAVTSATNSQILNTTGAGVYTLEATNTLSGCLTRTLVLVFACVGIDEPISDQSLISIYPNPANTYLNFKMEKAVQVNFEIINLLGEVLFSVTSTLPNGEINVSELQNGIYILKMETGNKVFTRTVVIQKE